MRRVSCRSAFRTYFISCLPQSWNRGRTSCYKFFTSVKIWKMSVLWPIKGVYVLCSLVVYLAKVPTPNGSCYSIFDGLLSIKHSSKVSVTINLLLKPYIPCCYRNLLIRNYFVCICIQASTQYIVIWKLLNLYFPWLYIHT